jgi:Protein of unknown function (DUF2510)
VIDRSCIRHLPSCELQKAEPHIPGGGDPTSDGYPDVPEWVPDPAARMLRNWADDKLRRWTVNLWLGGIETPEGHDKYRYWNGSEWTGHATATDHGNHRTIMFGGSCGGWHHAWYRRLLRNTVVFHTMAWFDCSVPLTRGHLRHFMQPQEQRTLDQIWALHDSM